ncbi:radical SAM protein [Tepidimicrobium xylanilyticum]|uniref:radical SAM protein n=1 Tax=Tepidimicrobium xylanilyticum TaxID=1123352 RepID=UPI00389A9237
MITLIRYSKILEKNPREIVLLKSHPCHWGRCLFCDYIHDNEKDDYYINEINKEVLKNITGEFKQLEVINSASVFQLPKETLEEIKNIVNSKGIERLYFESHYHYRHRLNEIRDYFKGIDIVFKCGIETFDDVFRNNYLNKGVYFKDYKEVAKYFESICLLVGIKGQTKEMIKRDIDILKEHFKYGCINIYIENTTPVKGDQELIQWFKENYSYLEEYDNIEILWNNTDFGVGGNEDEK